jgi:hypothetical protein
VAVGKPVTASFLRTTVLPKPSVSDIRRFVLNRLPSYLKAFSSCLVLKDQHSLR